MSPFDDTMRLAKRRVLVADDDDCVRTLCVITLRREGYHVESVMDGREALKKLDQGDYHAVVLDLGMPHIHGATVLSVIAQTRPEMMRRIIVLTGAPDAVIEPIIGLVGGILRKPAELDTLTRYVDQSGSIADDTGPFDVNRGSGCPRKPARQTMLPGYEILVAEPWATNAAGRAG